MKKFSTWILFAALAVGTLLVPRIVSAQAPERPHQIGLIDMGHIFQNYKKFKDQTTSLQAKADGAQKQVEAKMELLRGLQEKMQTVVAGSPEFAQMEAEGIKITTELQAFRQVEQREIIRQQAELYKQIYMEVQKAVGMYAKHYQYTLIIRFNRQEVSEAGKPEEIVQNMNRQVVYYQQQDDLTDPILQFLNDSYDKAAAGSASR